MNDSQPTRLSLIARVRDHSDAAAWREFISLYQPLILRIARHSGLQEADAEDIAQDVMRNVAAALPDLRIRPDGGFRKWLFTATRNRLTDHFRSAKQRDRGAGDSVALAKLAEIPAAVSEPDWDREYERHVLNWAAERVRTEFREATWQAFTRTAIDGRSGPDVAKELNMTAGAVHVARCRVLARLKAVVQEHLGDDSPV
jgi:RNA polymerase sigma factor (sigma-70 family)